VSKRFLYTNGSFTAQTFSESAITLKVGDRFIKSIRLPLWWSCVDKTKSKF